MDTHIQLAQSLFTGLHSGSPPILAAQHAVDHLLGFAANATVSVTGFAPATVTYEYISEPSMGSRDDLIQRIDAAASSALGA